MHLYTLGTSDVTELANQIKETVIAALREDGHLTDEKAQEVLGKYVIVAYEKTNVFGKMFAKLRGEAPADKDKLYYRVFKT